MKAFTKEIARLEVLIQLYQVAVQSLLEERTKQITAELLKALADTLKENPPPSWATWHLNETLDDAEVERLFGEDIHQALEWVRTDFNPRVRIDHKALTYETFKDPAFRRVIEERFGKKAIDRIFEEHDAAPEKKQDLFA